LALIDHPSKFCSNYRPHVLCVGIGSAMSMGLCGFAVTGRPTDIVAWPWKRMVFNKLNRQEQIQRVQFHRNLCRRVSLV